MADAIVVGAPVPRTEGASKVTSQSIYAAGANAVADAVGVRLFGLPISAERVYNALRTRNASGWTQGRVSPTITTSTGSYSEYRFP